MESVCFLGFTVSRYGIYVDPLKVKAILKLPPPSNISQLPSLQEKVNFLRRFISNYVVITKGFMWLLKKGVPFGWDDRAQCSFDVLKNALVSTQLLSPLEYSQDFILYLVASESTIGMVLIQEDESKKEEVIPYLSKGLISVELHYSHVERLALVVVHASNISTKTYSCELPLSSQTLILCNIFLLAK